MEDVPPAAYPRVAGQETEPTWTAQHQSEDPERETGLEVRWLPEFIL